MSVPAVRFILYFEPLGWRLHVQIGEEVTRPPYRCGYAILWSSKECYVPLYAVKKM